MIGRRLDGAWSWFQVLSVVNVAAPCRPDYLLPQGSLVWLKENAGSYRVPCLPIVTYSSTLKRTDRRFSVVGWPAYPHAFREGASGALSETPPSGTARRRDTRNAGMFGLDLNGPGDHLRCFSLPLEQRLYARCISGLIRIISPETEPTCNRSLGFSCGSSAMLQNFD
jgi:hypothetical protein